MIKRLKKVESCTGTHVDGQQLPPAVQLLHALEKFHMKTWG